MIAAHATPMRLCCAIAVVGRVCSTRGRKSPKSFSSKNVTTRWAIQAVQVRIMCYLSRRRVCNRCSGVNYNGNSYYRLGSITNGWGLAQSCTKRTAMRANIMKSPHHRRCCACHRMCLCAQLATPSCAACKYAKVRHALKQRAASTPLESTFSYDWLCVQLSCHIIAQASPAPALAPPATAHAAALARRFIT